MMGSLDFWGAILSFVGGTILSWDVLTIKKVKTEIGAQRLQEIFMARGLADHLTDDKGRPLKGQEDLQLWHARRSLARMRAGFILMTLGFFLEIVSFWINPSGSPST